MNPAGRVNGFFVLTGTTFAAFASGFGVCMFDLQTVDACLEVSRSWADKLHIVGDHIVQWAFAMGKGAFR